MINSEIAPMIRKNSVVRAHHSRQASQVSVSVILCTHNPRADYLHRVLASLREQTLPAERWEFLLVNNASSQPLEETWDISWHWRGRHVREDKLGLTAARLRGIEESSGELLIFVDDDNLLAPDFLAQALAISARSEAMVLGAFGAGVLKPEFEVQPAAGLRPYIGLLALRSVSSALQSNNPKDTACIPWGAGLCVTRAVANLYWQFVADLDVTDILDRRGPRLFSGGDDLFSRVAAEAGLGFGVLPELRITHLISASRLNERYFTRLIRDHALSHGVLAYLLDGIQPRRTTGLVGFVKLLLHAIKNGLFSMRCRWAKSRGEGDAAQFISVKCLKTLKTGGRNTRQRKYFHDWIQFVPIIPLVQALVEVALQ